MIDEMSELPRLSWPDLPAAAPPLAAVAGDVLPAFLPKQRWFADKGAMLNAIGLVDAVDIGAGQDAFLAIVEIAPSQRRYFVPFALAAAAANGRDVLARIDRGGRAGVLLDALATDAVPLALVADVRAQRRRPSIHGGTFVARAAPALDELALPQTPLVRRLSVEQSNTSIVVGGSLMLKAYRRVHRGPQAELEVARFLDDVGYRNTPALLGYIEYEQPGAEPTALCILQRFVPNSGDGWAATLAHLEGFFARNATGIAGPADEHDLQFTRTMHTLGRRTAELQSAFATPTGDAAFEPEPTSAADIDAWVTQARATAETALATLEREPERVPPSERAAAAALLARRAEIMLRLTVPPLGNVALMKTRYHGDFHLGQVLVVDDDFMIVDFEGEPGREPAARRRKSSPLRDVAGMLRSMNYAAVAGIRSVGADSVEAMQRRELSARRWEDRNVAAFLDGYRTTVAGCPSYPSDPKLAQRLLDLFVLEKAFYEMSYELANRPTWLRIPLDGIRAILDADFYALTVN